ncbi:MAG: MoaD/ThiS family protein [Carboxylicivirga sp.]|jgi:MoaD family protein|nr:MoaD/ThiS family protein [Carboxylicivirga sp.]
MKTIKVKYTAQLKKAVGKANDVLEVEETVTLEGCLKLLRAKYTDAFTNIVFDEDGHYLNAVLLVVNGVQRDFLDATAMQNGDELMIMSPIAGG